MPNSHEIIELSKNNTYKLSQEISTGSFRLTEAEFEALKESVVTPLVLLAVQSGYDHSSGSYQAWTYVHDYQSVRNMHAAIGRGPSLGPGSERSGIGSLPQYWTATRVEQDKPE
jgi:hypothetical protein